MHILYSTLFFDRNGVFFLISFYFFNNQNNYIHTIEIYTFWKTIIDNILSFGLDSKSLYFRDDLVTWYR